MDRRRRSAAVKKPLGQEISSAECAEVRRKIMADPSKQISRDDGTRRIQEFFASGALEGGMLSVPFKRLSLLCPITNKRIVDPARGVNCTHLECFDLTAYLGSQIKKPFWDCPICQKRLPADDLRIDEFTSYVLRDELDGVHSVEVYGNGSHRAVKRSESSRANSEEQARRGDDAITLDDKPMVVDNGDQESTESGPLVTLPLRLLQDFNSQTKDLLSRLPVKKGKRKADDPADLLEEHHDAVRNLIKQARATGTSHATTRVPEPLRYEALVTTNDNLRAENEELASRNSALLAENLRLNHRLEEFERNHASNRPNLRFIAASGKNTAEVLMWLDRFSLDAVQFTCTLFKAIVDVYLPMAPKRVLRSVTFDPYVRCGATLVARENVEKKIHGEREGIFRRMFALCSGCAIEHFKVDMADWTPTIRAIFADNLPLVPVRKAHLDCPFVLGNALIKVSVNCRRFGRESANGFQMMKGLQSAHIAAWFTQGVNDDTMRVCAKGGVANLIIRYCDGVTDEALLDFCFSNAPINGDAVGRTLFMGFRRKPTEISLSKNFFNKLVKKCRDEVPQALPSVTLRSKVDTTVYDEMAMTHASPFWMCTHFQFEASGEKFEIVVRKLQYGPDDLIVRKGHADIGECDPRRYFCEWEGDQIYL
ncbi:MIZ zinc finger family protein [Aphelenchoides avenae]|nr:MIZ zinc finger family protein [Aphelenchus avenae]